MGKCHFSTHWLTMKDSEGFQISEWGRKQGDELFCVVCEKTISIEKGFHAIRKHFETRKHKTNFQVKNGPSQLHLVSGASHEEPDSEMPKSIRLYSVKDSAYTAELIWCMKTVVSNMSAQSCHNIGNVFRAMFPTPVAVPNQFSLNPTKVGYLISDALAPYFRKMVLTEAQSQYFTLLYDETTNNAGMKELQTVIRFWSEQESKIVSHHLESFYMGHSTATDIKQNISLAMDKADLHFSKLLMLSSDGPNVNKSVFRLFNEQVKLVRGKGLIDIGFCNIHVLHNAFRKGLEEFGCDASDMVISVYNFFNDWPSRWQDFIELQKKHELPNMHFIKHVSSRWLTLEPAANRLLQQWDVIVDYFLKFIPLKNSRLMGSISYKKIVSFLEKKSLKAELKFICASSALFTKFTGLFQREEPLIHIMYREIQELILTIMGRVCKTEAIAKFRKNPEENGVFNAENLLALKMIPISDEMKCCLSSLSEVEKKTFLLNVRKHYVASGNYIIGKNIMTNSLLKCFSCLDPSELKKSDSLKKIINISSSLPIEINEEKLIDEWKLLQFETVNECLTIDLYWAQIFHLKFLETFKYPMVTSVVKAALSLSHGSAEVERGFSSSSRILRDDKACMSVRTLNARLVVKDALKRFENKPELVPITKDLLALAHVAYKSYNAYLEQERKAVEEKLEKTKKIEEAKISKEKKMRELLESQKDIENLKKQLTVAKNEVNIHTVASDKLLYEANKRLKKAIEKNDFTEAKLVQTIIEGIVKSKEECKEKVKNVNNLDQKLQKRKDSVITSFFSKKPKME